MRCVCVHVCICVSVHVSGECMWRVTVTRYLLSGGQKGKFVM